MKCAFIFFLNLLMCWKLVNCVLIECVSFPIKVDHHQRPDLVSLLFLSLSQRREASPNFFPTRKKKVGFICIIFVLFLKKNEKRGLICIQWKLLVVMEMCIHGQVPVGVGGSFA